MVEAIKDRAEILESFGASTDSNWELAASTGTVKWNRPPVGYGQMILDAYAARIREIAYQLISDDSGIIAPDFAGVAIPDYPA